MDLLDIKSWKPATPKDIADILLPQLKNTKHINLTLNSENIYSLHKLICTKPNGPLSLLGGNFPIDDFVWWDFVIINNNNFIHTTRTNLFLECSTNIDNENFSANNFFLSNFDQYQKEIHLIKSHFEKHSLYINHYKSYSAIVDYHYKQIKDLEVTIPNLNSHNITKSESKNRKKELVDFIKNSIALHVNAKSLILNCAFMTEAYINNFLRIFLHPFLRDRNEFLKQILKNKFETKLQSIDFLTVILNEKINMSNTIIRDVLKLMTIRNKYVHSDESSTLNKVGEVFFDGMYPLFDESKPLAVDSIQLIYKHPSKQEAIHFYEVSKNFIKYIESLIDKNSINIKSYEIMMNANPLGFNTDKKIYSNIYPNGILDVQFIFDKENPEIEN